jgi:hypothetical protein
LQPLRSISDGHSWYLTPAHGSVSTQLLRLSVQFVTSRLKLAKFNLSHPFFICLISYNPFVFSIASIRRN